MKSLWYFVMQEFRYFLVKGVSAFLKSIQPCCGYLNLLLKKNKYGGGGGGGGAFVGNTGSFLFVT